MSVWSDIAETVGKAAPLVGGLLAGPAGSSAGNLVANALGVENSPDSVQTALQNDPKWRAKLKALEQDHQRELRRMALEAETQRLAQVNRTMRAEAGSADPFVRRWRPTFGYLAALTWAAQTGAIVYAIVATPQWAAELIQSITALTPMWSVALAVLGIQVRERSKDKAVAAGQRPEPGILGAIAERIRAGGKTGSGGKTGDGGTAAGEAAR